MRMLADDWLCITGQSLEETSVSVYMLVLKGRLGVPVMLNATLDALPHLPRDDDDSASSSSSSLCYIANRMQVWCDDIRRNADVCDTLELRGIHWDALFAGIRPVAPQLLLGVSSVYISRRGGVMMRTLFPRKTKWSIDSEEAVLSDCNALLCILQLVLSGKPFP